MNDELYFKTDFIGECRRNISFFLNNMFIDVAGNDILHSVSIMTVINFCKKLILFKQAGII